MPSLRIAFSMLFAEQTGLKGGQKFDLLLGTGDDQGVARLVRNDAGLLACSRGAKGGHSFFCGHIERFGTEGRKKQFCAAESIDPQTIEITLPPWAVE